MTVIPQPTLLFSVSPIEGRHLDMSSNFGLKRLLKAQKCLFFSQFLVKLLSSKLFCVTTDKHHNFNNGPVISQL
jgi:hypothetical protein